MSLSSAVTIFSPSSTLTNVWFRLTWRELSLSEGRRGQQTIRPEYSQNTYSLGIADKLEVGNDYVPTVGRITRLKVGSVFTNSTAGATASGV